MIKQVAAIRYAKAYLAYSQKTNTLGEIVIESEKTIEIISNNSDLFKILKNKTILNQKKKRILLNICGSASENLKNLIEILVRKNRLYLFDDILNCYIEVKDVNYEDSLIIQNKFLLDLYQSQKNIIHFRGKNKNKSFLMNYKKTEIQLNLR